MALKEKNRPDHPERRSPTLILSMDPNQTLCRAWVKRLKVGSAHRISTITRESLVADLRTILAPQYVARAREIATRIKPAESTAAGCKSLGKISPAIGVLADRRRAIGVIGVGQLSRVAWERVDGIAAG